MLGSSRTSERLLASSFVGVWISIFYTKSLLSPIQNKRNPHYRAGILSAHCPCNGILHQVSIAKCYFLCNIQTGWLCPIALQMYKKHKISQTFLHQIFRNVCIKRNCPQLKDIKCHTSCIYSAKINSLLIIKERHTICWWCAAPVVLLYI